jgi:hypothetical protein
MNVDSGPVQTASEDIDAGKAEKVHAEIHMGAGELHVEGGAANLMAGSFRYSERVGRPVVKYEVTGASGRLTVESPKSGSSGGKSVNTWDLKMGSAVPLEMNVNLGAGESNLDMSQLPLRSLEVDMGAGEMTLNVAGKYARDVTVEVNGGVGEARIKLPSDMGAEVQATGGIGSVETKGLSKRDGKYYNDAYVEGKPAVHMQVQGGVGNIILSVGN